MNKGVTLVAVVASVLIISIILGITAVLGYKNINEANFNSFMQSMTMIEENIQMINNNESIVPNKGLIVGLPSNMTDVNKASFINEITLNKDKLNDLYQLDVSKIYKLMNIKGTGTIDDGDVYLFSPYTLNVYYLKGQMYKGNIYFGNNGKF